MIQTVQLTSGSPPQRLPVGWKLLPLDVVCDRKIENWNPGEKPDHEFQYVDISSIDNVAKRIIEPKTLLGQDAPSRARQVIRTGDVIVSTTRPNLNAVALVPPEFNDQVCSTGFCVLRPGSEIDPYYLFSFTQTRLFVEALSSLVKGALYPAVTDKQVRSQLIPVPPLPEQKRIATILTEQMAAVEKARKATEAQLEAAKLMSAICLRAIFNGSDSLRWPKRALAEICDVKGGKRLPQGADFAVGQTRFPYIRVVDFHAGSVQTENLKYLDEFTQKQIGRYIISNKDVYVSIAGTIGIVGVVPDCLNGANLTENAAKIVIRERGLLNRNFLAYFLQSPTGQTAIRQRTNTVGQPKLALERIATISIPLPPIFEQNNIASILSVQQIAIDRICNSLNEQLVEIEALPATLLRRVFYGKV